MDTDETATRIASTLRGEYPDSIFAVGWYDTNRSERTGVVYISEDFEELADRAPNVLRETLLESIGRELYERLHNETLHCTARIYDSLIDVDIPVTESAGVVIAISPDAGEQLMDIIDLTQTITPTGLSTTPDVSA